MTRGL